MKSMLQAFCSLCTIYLTCFSSWETVYNQVQENFFALPVRRLARTGTPVWSNWLLWLTEKRKTRGTFSSLSYAEMDYGLSQQLPRRCWVPVLHSGCCTLAWEGGSGVWDTKTALCCVPNMASCWVLVSRLCHFPYLSPQHGIPPGGIILCQHNSVYHSIVLLKDQ